MITSRDQAHKAMKIGIVSDTHDNIEEAQRAAKFFEGNVEKVIHCGDIIAPFTAEIFNCEFDFYAVRGNNDGEWDLKSTIGEFGEFHNNIMELELDGLNIGVYHGTEEEIVDGLIQRNYDYLFRGHTHKRKEEVHEDTVEVNPGSIKIPGQEEKFSVAVLDTENEEINFKVFR